MKNYTEGIKSIVKIRESLVQIRIEIKKLDQEQFEGTHYNDASSSFVHGLGNLEFCTQRMGNELNIEILQEQKKEIERDIEYRIQSLSTRVQDDSPETPTPNQEDDPEARAKGDKKQCQTQ